MSAVASVVIPTPKGRRSKVSPRMSTDDLNEAIRKAYLDALLMDVEIEERIELRVKPGFDTACWAFLPPHRIYVGDGIPAKAKKSLTDNELARYIRSHVFHEMAHGLWTERDLKKVNADLAKIEIAPKGKPATKGVPFSLFNAFEDARIEDRWRDQVGEPFEWTEFEDVEIGLAPNDPNALFFMMVQYEGDLDRTRKIWGAVPENEAALFDEVESFYRKTLSAGSSEALYPILKEWCERFGIPPATASSSLGSKPGQNPEGTPTDLTLTALFQTNPEALEEFEQGTVQVNPIGGKPQDEDDGNVSVSEKKEAGQVEVTEIEGNADLLSSGRGEVYDVVRAKKLAQRLSRLFESETRKYFSQEPSKHLSVKNLVLKRDFYVHNETHQRGRQSVLIVVDCSGSMGGHHIDESRVLVECLSDLARKGIVTGHVVLSAVIGWKSCWQRFKLPMRTEHIRRIRAFAVAEGLEGTLQANLKEAQKADYVFVYTDGQICDKPIDKRYFHARGIHTWGLYAGHDLRYLDSLSEYFDKALIRENADLLVEAMVTRGKKSH
jgi:hypothetical protein